MNRSFHYTAASVAIALALGAIPAAASSGLEVSGWIPYWRAPEGISDARSHLSDLDIVHPFGYSVKNDGSLKDLFGFNKSAWKSFAKRAKSRGVNIVPTVMWSDGGQINAILSDDDAREEHIEEIVRMVKKGRFDGVDIDYEGKLAATHDHFATFLEELKDELGSKMLSCTIEARTPPDSLYSIVPASIEYANDFDSIGRYCDRVNIMAYDQGRADIKLNSARRGVPYVPVADADWVRKVAELAARSIPKEKIVLGAATYGYEYEVTVSPQWFQDYKRLWSLSPNYGNDTADDYAIEPSRNAAGELHFSYVPKDSPYSIVNLLYAPAGTASGDAAAAKALIYANLTGQTVKVNYVTWSDAGAIKDKLRLADEFGLRGIAMFRIDGGEDEEIWDKLGD